MITIRAIAADSTPITPFATRLINAGKKAMVMSTIKSDLKIVMLPPLAVPAQALPASRIMLAVTEEWFLDRKSFVLPTRFP